MVWIPVALAAICAAFIGVYYRTGDIWTAANAAGAIVLLSLAVLVVRMTRPPVTTQGRRAIAGLFALLIAGATAHWLIMWSTTNYQYDTLQTIRRTIERGILYSKMEDRSMASFAAYYTQKPRDAKTLGDVFRAQNPQMNPDSHLLDTLDEGMKVYATVVSDSLVELKGESGITFGRSGGFTNVDGRSGFLQVQLRLTPEGVERAAEN